MILSGDSLSLGSLITLNSKHNIYSTSKFFTELKFGKLDEFVFIGKISVIDYSLKLEYDDDSLCCSC